MPASRPSSLFSLILLSLLALPSAPARAAVESSAADGFAVKHVFDIAATPAAAWKALLTPSKYWPKAHTWSGDPANLSMRARAGGCFCEVWKGNEVEHARVVMSLPGQLLRLDGALGPMQEMALAGSLTIKLEASGEATKATVTYRVSGDSMHRLDGFAAVVDGVLGEQFGRWARFAETGSP